MHPLVHRIVSRRNILIIAAAAFFSLLFWYVHDFQAVAAWLTTTFGQIVAYNHVLAASVFILLAVLSGMITFFTSTPLVPVAVAIWGTRSTLIFLIGGWVLGSVAAYWIGYAASPLLRRFTSIRKVEKYRRALDGSLDFFLIFLFRLAVPSELASYTLGLLRYKFLPYVVITIITEAPFGFLAIYSSQALFDLRPHIFIALMILGTLAISTFAYFFQHRLRIVRSRHQTRASEMD